MFKLNVLLQKISGLARGLWIILSIAFMTACAANNTVKSPPVEQAGDSEWSSSYAKLQALSAEEIEQLSIDEAFEFVDAIPAEKIRVLIEEKFPEGISEESPLKPETNWKGKQAPDFTLKDLSGKEHKLSDFRGKYVFLDFWGTWCEPCVALLPKIRKVYDQVDKSKIEFIGICVGCHDVDMKEFVKENGLSWLQLVDNDGIGEIYVNEVYSINSFPTPLLIDPNGKVVEDGSSPERSKRFLNLMDIISLHVK